ncbi:MAG: HD domain-containing protein [Candidatus Bathyarchaeia archaeon]
MKLNYYLSQFSELKALYKLVKHDFLKKGLLHHNWHHILRDLARAIIIGEAEKANMKIVLAGVLLHDIGRLYPDLGSDHHEAGAIKAQEYLKKAGFRSEEVSEITHCIRAHGPRGIEEPKTLEAKVVYDADVLSCSVGYIGVARVFDYFMREENMGVKDMMEIPSGKKGPRRDFYTKTGKAMGIEGLKEARRFWQELRYELKEEEKTVKSIIPEYKGD